MPIGVLCNVLAVALGGILGALGGRYLPQSLKEKLNLIFGICSIGIGISSISLMRNMPAVVLALILGTALGVLLHLGEGINRCGEKIASLFPGGEGSEGNAMLVTAIVLFCSSGTGIYGAIVSGMNGDHSILIAKSFLDLFTAMIFACSLGMSVAVIALPQAAIFLILFYAAGVLYPLTTPGMIDDFKACGGLIMVATGLRIAGIRDFPIADMIPAMLLVWFFSAAWSGWVVPIL